MNSYRKAYGLDLSLAVPGVVVSTGFRTWGGRGEGSAAAGRLRPGARGPSSLCARGAAQVHGRRPLVPGWASSVPLSTDIPDLGACLCYAKVLRVQPQIRCKTTAYDHPRYSLLQVQS